MRATDRYVLGPVLQCAQERFPKDATLNPTFELTYWRWGLETAQKWRERLGMPRDPEWDGVLEKLAKPLVVDGKYAFTETTPDSYTNPKWNDDHPAVLAAFGMLPGPGIDRADDAAHARLGLAELELAEHVGLGLSDGRDVCGAARRTGTRGRRLAARHAEERLSRERPQLSAARSDDLSARQRRAAHGDRHDGGGLGWCAGSPCARISGQWEVESSVGESSALAITHAAFSSQPRVSFTLPVIAPEYVRRRIRWLVAVHLCLAASPLVWPLIPLERFLPALWAVYSVPIGGMLMLSFWVGLGSSRLVWRIAVGLAGSGYLALWPTAAVLTLTARQVPEVPLKWMEAYMTAAATLRRRCRGIRRHVFGHALSLDFDANGAADGADASGSVTILGA